METATAPLKLFVFTNFGFYQNQSKNESETHVRDIKRCVEAVSFILITDKRVFVLLKFSNAIFVTSTHPQAAKQTVPKLHMSRETGNTVFSYIYVEIELFECPQTLSWSPAFVAASACHTIEMGYADTRPRAAAALAIGP